MNKLVTIVPAEDVGRDTISRFDMQFQAAAFAALQILEGKGIDCVYCDYHDDFVVRRVQDGRVSYHFFQVKTKQKQNHQWDLAEIFAFKKRGQKKDPESLAKIRASFAGKLLIHGIVFGQSCAEVTLLSNVYFNDEVVTAIDECRGKAPKSKAAAFLADNFSAIFTIEPELAGEAAVAILAKLSIQPAVQYIAKDRDAFASAARSAIFKYSEVDLSYHETNEIANNLVELVYRKSKEPLEGISPDEIDQRVGVGLDDLLRVLSISRAVYDALISGADPKAIRTASILQRWLTDAGATQEMIDYVSTCKASWDIWLRRARHTYSPFDLNFLLENTDKVYETWIKAGAKLVTLHALLDAMTADAIVKQFHDLTRELLLGAVCSIGVRRH
ncbi:dsDNA nuclease domain-containing protein [Paraburkholderia tropica]|uniref:dsDNA nuclease domain-containing protein n=1 Tax=Paraburkholderia tropica TaxID=92647 RepID=UPI002AB7EBB0|nr:dsDNA nuclease domain-containing protein [Paraburkholderia tropica]